MLLKRRCPCAAGSVIAVIALAVSLFVVAAPAGASPGPHQPYQLADQLSPSPSPGAGRADHQRPGQGVGARRNNTTSRRFLAGGPGDAREDGQPAEGDMAPAHSCAAPRTDRRDRGVRDRRRSRLSGRRCPHSSVNDAQSAAVYSDVVVHTLNAAVNQLHVVSAKLRAERATQSRTLEAAAQAQRSAARRELSLRRRRQMQTPPCDKSRGSSTN